MKKGTKYNSHGKKLTTEQKSLLSSAISCIEEQKPLDNFLSNLSVNELKILANLPLGNIRWGKNEIHRIKYIQREAKQQLLVAIEDNKSDTILRTRSVRNKQANKENWYASIFDDNVIDSATKRQTEKYNMSLAA